MSIFSSSMFKLYQQKTHYKSPKQTCHQFERSTFIDTYINQLDFKLKKNKIMKLSAII